MGSLSLLPPLHQLLWFGRWGMFLCVIALAVLVLLATFKRRRHAGDVTACGACGYPARGDASSRCSECGAEYLKAGMVTPRMARRLLMPAATPYLAWLALLLMAWPWAVGYADQYAVQPHPLTQLIGEMRLSPKHSFLESGPGVPATWRQVVVSVKPNSVYDPVDRTATGDARIVLLDDNPSIADVRGEMRIDYAAGTIVATLPDGTVVRSIRAVDVDDRFVMDVVQAAGFDLTGEGASRFLVDLTVIVQTTVRSPQTFAGVSAWQNFDEVGALQDTWGGGLISNSVPRETVWIFAYISAMVGFALLAIIGWIVIAMRTRERRATSRGASALQV